MSYVIPQPIAADYSYKSLHAFYHEDTVYVAGCLVTGDTFVQSFNVMLHCWKEEKDGKILKSTEEYCYTNPVTVTGLREDLFLQ